VKKNMAKEKSWNDREATSTIVLLGSYVSATVAKKFLGNPTKIQGKRRQRGPLCNGGRNCRKRIDNNPQTLRLKNGGAEAKGGRVSREKRKAGLKEKSSPYTTLLPGGNRRPTK